MRTLIRNSALFLVVFIGMALVIDYVLLHEIIFRNPDANAAKFRQLCTTEDPTEIPVFGSSKGRSSFIPDSLGDGVFNYSMEKCNYDVFELLLDIELAKPRKTAVIIEFNHRFFVPSPAHTINTATFIPSLDQPMVEDYLKRKDRWDIRFDIPGFRYYGSALDYIRGAFRGSTGQKKIISRGGLFMDMVPSEDVFRSQVDARYADIKERNDLLYRSSHKEEAISIEDRRKLKMMDAMLLFTEPKDRVDLFESQLASRPDRPILIVVTPYHPSELASVANYDRMMEKFNEWEERFPNVHVFNYAKMVLPDSDFKNSSHMNITGARVFSSALRRDAKQYLGPKTEK